MQIFADLGAPDEATARRLTLEAIADVGQGLIVDDHLVQAWARSLSDAAALPAGPCPGAPTDRT